jgi:DNA-binding GntR family transcriptional regulator
MKDAKELSTLSDEAYESVRQRILRGQLPMGQGISRRTIAAELGMSFLPVSEALMRLELEGLLESSPRAGTRVRIPSREDVKGHYIVREALETQAARQFAGLAKAKDRSELKSLALRVDALSKKANRLQYLQLHKRLHHRIAECAGCPALTLAIEQTHSLASTWLCVPIGSDLVPLDRSHEELIRGLCTGNPVVAAEAMRGHIQRSLERTVIRLAPYFELRVAHGGKFARKKPQTVQPK